jgi:hypothetical protein
MHDQTQCCMQCCRLSSNRRSLSINKQTVRQVLSSLPCAHTHTHACTDDEDALQLGSDDDDDDEGKGFDEDLSSKKKGKGKPGKKVCGQTK